jgi:hypothetical protein
MMLPRAFVGPVGKGRSSLNQKLQRLAAAFRPRPHVWKFVVLLVVFFLVGLALAYPALSWPMAFDDLVLLRTFTRGQIAASFHGQWDPEKLMNRGFRPGSLVFNHIRYTLLGENVIAHRLFLLLLYALYGALLVPLVSRFGLPRPVAVLGVIASMCAIYSVFHYVWLTDGNHLVQGLAFVVAARLLMTGLETHCQGKLALSFLALTTGLLTREDTFAAVPALVVLGHAETRRCGRSRGLFLGYVVSTAALCLMLHQYRHWVVPGAQPLGYDLLGVLEAFWRVLHLIGATPFDAWSSTFIVAWRVILLVAVILGVRYRRAVSWKATTMWFACAFLACSPALNLQRDNLLFFPVSFVALFCASLWWELSLVSHLGKTLAITALVTSVVGGGYTSRIFAENFHPQSLRVIWWNGRYVYGAYSRKAAIPRHRLEAVMKQLAYAGIRDEWLHLNRTPKLVRRAVAAGHRRAGAAAFFYPLLPWYED